MSDVPAQPKAAPLLVTLLEQLDQSVAQLKQVTTNHRLLRSSTAGMPSLSVAHASPNLSLSIQIGDATVPVPLPTDPAAREAMLQEAVASLGDEAVRLWRGLHAITASAVQHLDGIAAKAQQG